MRRDKRNTSIGMRSRAAETTLDSWNRITDKSKLGKGLFTLKVLYIIDAGVTTKTVQIQSIKRNESEVNAY